jgi:rRNA maturation RNase YbeY
VPVYFHSEDTRFELKRKKIYKGWIKSVIDQHNKSVANINIVFCSNEYILEINKLYLNHNYHTDVITFNYNEGIEISGDIFVSVEQVRLNCQEHNVSFQNELSRVIIHGVLHLLAYDDSTSDEQSKMRSAEDLALKQFGGKGDGIYI